MGERPTMNDVAREAGVALKTVSRFVNGATNIDPSLAARIAAAIDRLGYRRNLTAASIRPGWRTRTFGLIIGDLANPYYATLARAVERVVAAAGYLLVTSSSEEDGERHDRIVDRMLEQRVDGFIIVPPRIAGRPWSAIATPVPPVVFVDRAPDDAPGDVVVADDEAGARAGVGALHAAGARSVAFVGDALEIPTLRARHAGWRAAADDAGVRHGPMRDGAHSAAEAERIVGELLDDGVADAVFAANNRATLGALAAFRARGRRLPLVGFDDFEGAALMHPPVSVVHQDIEGMGGLAARLLLDRLDEPTRAPQVHTVTATLIARGSEQPDPR